MKKGLTITIAILMVALLWYFLIKPQDYQIRVVAKSNTGTINQALKAWNNTLPNATVRQLNNLGNLEQKVVTGDSTHIYNWNITPITESTSQLIVNVKDEDHSMGNKLVIPFYDTDF